MSSEPEPTDLSEHLRKNAWSHLISVFAQHGVKKIVHLQGKTEDDLHNNMKIPMRIAQQLVKDFSYGKTEVGKKLLEAGFSNETCKIMYENSYHTLEHTKLLNTSALQSLGITGNEAQDLLNLLKGDRSYEVFISHSHATAPGTTQILCERLKLEFARKRIFVDLEKVDDLKQLQEDVRRSKTILALLSEPYISSPYCMLELLEAFKVKIPICPCVVDNTFNRKVFDDLDEWWGSLRPVGEDTAEEFLRVRGFSKVNFEVLMRYLKDRITEKFEVGIPPPVQKGQFDSVVKKLRAALVTYANRTPRTVNPRSN